MGIIDVTKLSKSYRMPAPSTRGGFWAATARVFRRRFESTYIVKDLTFAIEAGESVGFIGPNGAGKSTTIKLLTGILTPSAGEVRVMGFVPHKERYRYTYHIGLVLAQKSLLWWNIPVIESLKLYRDIYEIPEKDFKERVEYFSDILGIAPLLGRATRTLSFGERMRIEIVASLLHKPRIIFLDEPTVALDIVARQQLKEFLRRVNREEGTTLFLTTHNTFDVEDLCDRVIILNKGQIVYDGKISILREIEQYKIVSIDYAKILDTAVFSRIKQEYALSHQNGQSIQLKVPNGHVPTLISKVTRCCALTNLNVQPPNLEFVIRRIYTDGRQ